MSVIDWAAKTARIHWRRSQAALTGRSAFDSRGVSLDMDAEGLDADARQRVLSGQFGPHERYVKPIVEEIAATRATVVEIGAGIGYFSTRINARLPPGTTHIAVEANPNILPGLARTRELNDATFDIVNAAYAPHESEVPLNLYDSYTESSIDSTRGDVAETVTVETTTLADLIDRFDLGRFTLYANMEGAEYDMLDAEFELLRERCPLIVIGFHEFTDDPAQDYVARMDDAFDRVWPTEMDIKTRMYRNPHLG